MIEIEGLVKHYHQAAGLRAMIARRGAPVRAVDGVSLSINAGEVVGLVGESGSGKSTIARLLVGLEQPTAGAIRLNGSDGLAARRHDPRAFHRRVQMVFQDPYGSLNPQLTVGEIVARPLRYQGVRDRSVIARKVDEALAAVDLQPVARYRDEFPHRLSGGQRQRVGIARAIVLDPSFLVADEPVSMLDVSIKWGVVRLLKRLVEHRQIAMLYITHDLAAVGTICDRLAIMYRGRIVETGTVDAVLDRPRHPYTRALIASVPSIEAGKRPAREINDENPEPSLAGGCRFAPRCLSRQPDCGMQEPAIEPGVGHRWACLHPADAG